MPCYSYGLHPLYNLLGHSSSDPQLREIRSCVSESGSVIEYSGHTLRAVLQLYSMIATFAIATDHGLIKHWALIV